ncbi:MAG TPA: hypothetical protein VLJ68_09875 [Chitinophagaceae bacterium]|nr:hypothetical protein [Chitinophagaceae bacterium]
MKKFIYLIPMMLFAVIVQAQDNTYLLYSFKGNVSFVEKNVETKARVGKILYSDASIKVAANSTVTLICNETAMFTVKKTGSFPMTAFRDSCSTHSSSVSSNYIKYVWSQMTTVSGTPGSNRKAFMNTVGAVSRGDISNVWIDGRLDTINYVNGEFPLSWKSYNEAKKYTFMLYSNNNIETPMFTTEVSKEKLAIPSFADRMKPGDSYYWSVAIKGEESDQLKVLKYIKKEDFNKMVDQMKKSGGIDGEEEADQAYRVAFMLEDAHYLAEAYKYYAKAAQLKPDNQLYRSTLMSFKKDYEIK